MRALLFAAPVVLLGGVGCTSVEPADTKTTPATYVTGSNIARRTDKPNESVVQSRSGDDLRRSPGFLPEFVGAPEDYRGVRN